MNEFKTKLNKATTETLISTMVSTMNDVKKLELNVMIQEILEGRIDPTGDASPLGPQVDLEYQPPAAFQDIYEKSGAGLGANYSPYGGNV